jgi:hypothetical protein
MEHLKSFHLFESFGIEWSGVDVTKAPVIGKIATAPFKFGEREISGEEYDVVEIVGEGDNKIYITSQWYKSGVPQLVHGKMVDQWIPAK